MASTPTASPSKFVWRELLTLDPEAAKRFYGELFGWQWTAMPMGEGHAPYHQAAIGETTVAGILQLDCELDAAFWAPYIAVADVDGATETAASLGASVVVPPTDLPEVGRFSFLHDPQGAAFYLFCATNGESTDAAPTPGEFCWDHLNTSDPAGAIAFYTQLTGWGTQSFGPVTFLTYGPEATPLGVVSQAPPGVKAHWLSYVLVDDLAATNAKAKTLGAEIIEERIEVPGKGAFALLKDPSGALFMLSEPTKA
ncbi:27 kDa antigen Cfp30B [compost metagenome]